MTAPAQSMLERERERLRNLLRDVRHEVARLEAYLDDPESDNAFSDRCATSNATNLGWRAQEIIRSTAIIETLTRVQRDEATTKIDVAPATEKTQPERNPQ